MGGRGGNDLLIWDLEWRGGREDAAAAAAAAAAARVWVSRGAEEEEVTKMDFCGGGMGFDE